MKVSVLKIPYGTENPHIICTFVQHSVKPSCDVILILLFFFFAGNVLSDDVLVEAGTNVSIGCPGMTRNTFVVQLEWRCIGPCGSTGSAGKPVKPEQADYQDESEEAEVNQV